MTILVTAATGNIGKEIAKQLVEAGEQPRIYVRDENKAKTLISDGDYQLAVGDVTDLAALESAMEGVDAVYTAVLDAYREDTTYLQNIITAAKKAGTKRIVLMSAFKVENYPDMPFIQWHNKAESELMASGLDWTILRPDWFMQNFLAYVKEGQLNLPMGNGKNSFIDTQDIAAVAIAALKDSKHAGKAYALSGPEAMDHYQVAETITKVTGRPCVFNNVDPQLVKQGLEAQGYEEWYVNMYLDITSPMRDGDVRSPQPDLEQVLNRKPVTLAKFIEKNLAHFLDACPE